MPQTPAISIVTTVYDAKEYLPRTVQSILAQTFTDFELLLVEDGSPNGCGELCDELANPTAAPLRPRTSGWTTRAGAISALSIRTI